MFSQPTNPDSAEEQQSASAHDGHELELLLADEWNRPLRKRLLDHLRDTLSPEKLPPLHLTSRPVDVGMLAGDILSLPWYRTVFTNLGDVISPETLPPLQLESRPVDVGELIGDQMSHMWWSSLLRSLADVAAPETIAGFAVDFGSDGRSQPDCRRDAIAAMVLSYQHAESFLSRQAEGCFRTGDQSRCAASQAGSSRSRIRSRPRSRFEKRLAPFHFPPALMDFPCSYRSAGVDWHFDLVEINCSANPIRYSADCFSSLLLCP